MEIHLLPTKQFPKIQEFMLDEKALNLEYDEEIQLIKSQKLLPSKEVLKAVLDVLNETKAGL